MFVEVADMELLHVEGIQLDRLSPLSDSTVLVSVVVVVAFDVLVRSLVDEVGM